MASMNKQAVSTPDQVSIESTSNTATTTPQPPGVQERIAVALREKRLQYLPDVIFGLLGGHSTRATVSRWVRSGCPAIRIGRSLYSTPELVSEWLASRPVGS